jgi:hypothetical protein
MLCGRHVEEHRQKLSIQLENTMQKHDLVEQDLNRSIPHQTILDKINVWENEIIIKI